MDERRTHPWPTPESRTISRLAVFQMIEKIGMLYGSSVFIYKESGDAVYVKHPSKNEAYTLYEQPSGDRPETIGDVEAIIKALDTR